MCILQYLLEGGNDILTSSPTNANWKPSRMLIQKTMKMFGNELFKVEDILSDQMNDLVTKVNAFVGKAVDMRDIVEDMVTGTILTLLTGTKSSAYSKQREMMKLAERSAISCLGIGNSVILDKVPWSRFVYYQSIRNYLKLRQALKLKRNLWNELWAESLKTYEIDKPQCVLHVMADMINENSFNYLPQMNETFLRGIIFNFYTGGISTTASSVYALLNILLHHTKVMLNLQKEVDSVTNLSRRPTLADKDKMPYTMATIYELLRYTSVVPLSSRLTLENSTIAGFDIPSNTGIHLLYWAVHHDEEFWGDPWIFRPERFLNTGGKLLAADHPTRKHVLAFGAGMRVCVGEVFALRRLFLFTTYIAQSFNIYPDDLNSMTSCDPRTYTSGLVLRPQSFRIKMKSRN